MANPIQRSAKPSVSVILSRHQIALVNNWLTL
jgi:hypothetical protein